MKRNIKKCTYAIVGTEWSNLKWQAQTPFSDTTNIIIQQLAKEYQISLEDIFCTNAITAPSIEYSLEDDLKEVQPKVILALGNAASILLGRSVDPARERGRIIWSPERRAHIIPTLAPAKVLFTPDSFPEVQRDFRVFFEAVNLPDGPFKHPKPNVTCIYSLEDYWKHVSAFKNPTDNVVAVDIETTGFDVFQDQILSIGVGFSEDEVFIFTDDFINTPSNKPILEKVLGNPNWTYVYQNGKFDVKFMRAIPTDDFPTKKKCIVESCRCDFDTMLAHYCIDERSDTQSLKYWAKEEYNAPDWEEELKQFLPTRKSSFGDIPRDILYEYQGYDVYYTRKGYYTFTEKMKADNTFEVFQNVYMPAVEAFTQIELAGTTLDLERLQEFFKDAGPQIELATAALTEQAILVGWNPVKYAAIKTAERQKKAGIGVAVNPTPAPKEFNPKSHPQLSHVAYDLCKMPLFQGKKTCNKEAVDAYEHLHPFWKALANYKRVTDLFGTFIKGMLERVYPDKKIRPDFLLHGTRTGRISCQNPNLQNLPRGSIVKDMFIADEGCLVVNADYKTLEVVVASILSKDVEMQAPFIHLTDFHSQTANAVYAKEIEDLQNAIAKKDRKVFEQYLANTMMLEIREKVSALLDKDDFEHAYKEMYSHMRFLTKFITFGIMYGREATSLANRELQCSKAQAQKYMDMFFKKYPQYTAWLHEQFHNAKSKGFVTNAFGFKRRWPIVTRENEFKVRNQSWNTPVQGSAAMVTVSALSRIQKRLSSRGIGRVLFTVHDSIVCNIKQENIKEGIQIMHEEMTRDVFGALNENDVPLVAEFEVGKTYKKVYPVDLQGDKLIPDKEMPVEISKWLEA